MKTIKFYFSLVVLSLSVLLMPLRATTFHAILIGDTDDHEISQVVKTDLKEITIHLSHVVSSLDAVDEYNQMIYQGKRANKRILRDLKQLNIQREDIVFLYFSGHGFNIKKNSNQWPFLYFNHGDVGVYGKRLINVIQSYDPKLFICFFDCCNNVLKPKDVPVLLNTKEARDAPTYSIKNVRKLFQESTGSILIVSASPGYYSEGTDKKGSCFTNSYLKTFSYLMSLDLNCEWEDILSIVQNKLWHSQRPYYELNLD